MGLACLTVSVVRVCVCIYVLHVHSIPSQRHA